MCKRGGVSCWCTPPKVVWLHVRKFLFEIVTFQSVLYNSRWLNNHVLNLCFPKRGIFSAGAVLRKWSDYQCEDEAIKPMWSALIAIPTLSDSSLQNCFQTVATVAGWYYKLITLCWYCCCTFQDTKVNDSSSSDDALRYIKQCKTVQNMFFLRAERSSRMFKAWDEESLNPTSSSPLLTSAPLCCLLLPPISHWGFPFLPAFQDIIIDTFQSYIATHRCESRFPSEILTILPLANLCWLQHRCVDLLLPQFPTH